MANFEVTKKSVETTATYQNENYKADVNFQQNDEGEVQSLSMSLYKKSGEYAGNANASKMAGGELQYTFSSISQSILTEITELVKAVSDEIASYVVAESADKEVGE